MINLLMYVCVYIVYFSCVQLESRLNNIQEEISSLWSQIEQSWNLLEVPLFDIESFRTANHNLKPCQLIKNVLFMLFIFHQSHFLFRFSCNRRWGVSRSNVWSTLENSSPQHVLPCWSCGIDVSPPHKRVVFSPVSQLISSLSHCCRSMRRKFARWSSTT